MYRTKSVVRKQTGRDSPPAKYVIRTDRSLSVKIHQLEIAVMVSGPAKLQVQILP